VGVDEVCRALHEDLDVFLRELSDVRDEAYRWRAVLESIQLGAMSPSDAAFELHMLRSFLGSEGRGTV
jgi:hypothetical protein